MSPHALRKWPLVAAFWLVQGAVAYAALAAWTNIAEGVDGPAGKPWGTPSWSDWLRIMAEPDFVKAALLLIALVTALQALFLIPVRRPQRGESRGWPVTVSLAVAGLGAATLAVAAALVIAHLLDTLKLGLLDHIDGRTFFLFLTAWALFSWGVATPLLIAFCRRRGRPASREHILSRAASVLFIGTVVETAALMPIDVMIRRRTDCYCTGAYLGFILCGSVGLFALGPAILLPILARRRKRWLGSMCDACGYDMTGCPTGGGADRCPECGAGWRRA